MSKAVSIKKFIQAIQKLPSDKPRIAPGKWYLTQKDHWLGWLREYDGPGAYGRKGSKNQYAEFAYNHIVQYRMLLWIIEAAGVDAKLVKQAKASIDDEKSVSANSAAVRKLVSWKDLADALWKNQA